MYSFFKKVKCVFFNLIQCAANLLPINKLQSSLSIEEVHFSSIPIQFNLHDLVHFFIVKARETFTGISALNNKAFNIKVTF